ncbi:MAG: hypothetical protein RL419_780 [Actinomycetota bacterium]
MLEVSASHWSSSGLEREQRTTPIGRTSKVEFTQTNVRENQMVFRSVAAAPQARTRSSRANGTLQILLCSKVSNDCVCMTVSQAVPGLQRCNHLRVPSSLHLLEN